MGRTPRSPAAWSGVVYQAFPKRIEEGLLAAGATPVVERGIADAAGDFDGMATQWMDNLWATLGEEYAADISGASGPRYEVQLLTESDVRPAIVSEQAYPLTVVANEELVADATGLWDLFLVAAGVVPQAAALHCCRIGPGALLVPVPRHRPGATPAGRPPGQSAIRRLASAVGRVVHSHHAGWPRQVVRPGAGPGDMTRMAPLSVSSEGQKLNL